MNKVNLTIDGRKVRAPANSTIAAVLLSHGFWGFRRSVSGEPRSALCGMGTCFECRVKVNGTDDIRSCVAEIEEGMTVETGT